MTRRGAASSGYKLTCCWGHRGGIDGRGTHLWTEQCCQWIAPEWTRRGSLGLRWAEILHEFCRRKHFQWLHEVTPWFACVFILTFNHLHALFFTPHSMQGRSSPKHDVIIKIVAGTHAGDGALRCKARLDEGSRMEHAQQGVNENLEWDGNTR